MRYNEYDMSDQTEVIPTIEGPGKKNRKNGKGVKPGSVPTARVQVAGKLRGAGTERERNPRDSEVHAESSPNGNTNGTGNSNGHANGNGKLEVKPVKARVSILMSPVTAMPTGMDTATGTVMASLARPR